mmetsp:Transcript_3220/g.4359  ORF Transcript_3220/g.4359 Transcript_3220/m.4359 type:complete len:161 (+) Transcript_3220:99-581(+)|eukprot:CAMPEP_0194751596 /NCGR_PEP_ID=MMETSP0323_2-20130528/5604_1 /TAXON_ID=2866 ORGANISM="Crypthecodinium cohnii, Strain Seligo" /NCGR_SAMPLE_ID=MMETSP0323_2 /ASSEMBLY_ACC=CAM_ASM_000346 /LENGTH=160 /DNA_ID=CAMNT_0039668151 /DNA_START=101 /DNA_END=583 /DNA_ORIENTATION=+
MGTLRLRMVLLVSLVLLLLCCLETLGMEVTDLPDRSTDDEENEDRENFAAISEAQEQFKHRRAEVELQLSLRTRRLRAGSTARSGSRASAAAMAGGTVGFKLHRRHERVHIWSEACRHLPMKERPACERKVDVQVLDDPTWQVLAQNVTPSALTLPLDHD